MAVTAAGARSVGELLDLVDDGGQPQFLLFWGHRPPASGGVGKGCLSQWWPIPFTVDGLVQPSAEHFMMAGKALLFGDLEAAERIRQAPDPGAAKDLGRQVAGFDEQRWTQRRFDIVVTGNIAKFSQHPDLRRFLLATDDRVLVEASPQDRAQGIGLAAADERAASPAHWQGLNLLGFALMEVRHRLRAASTAQHAVRPDTPQCPGATSDGRQKRAFRLPAQSRAEAGRVSVAASTLRPWPISR